LIATDLRTGKMNIWAHIDRMTEYADQAFTVLVHIPVDNGASEREIYVIGCSSREEAEARIRHLHPYEPDIKVLASPLSAAEAEDLQLTVGEIRPWQ
jgi:hypothetical protein